MKALSFGEVLFDVVGDQEHLGGAPLNFAAHMAQLGARSAILTRVGGDERGRCASAAIRGCGVSLDFMQIDDEHPTGVALVHMAPGGLPSYELPTNAAYDHIVIGEAEIDAVRAFAPAVIYCGTLAQRGDVSRASLLTLLEANVSRHIFFDINLRQQFYSASVIRDTLRYATIGKWNDAEAATLKTLLFGGDMSDDELAARVIGEFSLEAVCVTYGGEGCRAYTADRQVRRAGVRVRVADTIGAGDAFSAAFLSEYLRSGDIDRAAASGNALGAYVASCDGAIPRLSEAIRAQLTL